MVTSADPRIKAEATEPSFCSQSMPASLSQHQAQARTATLLPHKTVN